MQQYFIEEDINGELYICDEDGKPIARFDGDDAFKQALDWAQRKGFELYSTLSRDGIIENYGLAYRRTFRRFRLLRQRSANRRSQDPPNVQRIIIPNMDDFLSDDEEWEDDEIELIPHEEPTDS